MRRLRIGIIGAGALTEWGILPSLFGADIAAPSDDGAWWSRRPAASTAIRWQPTFRPEVVALCERDAERRERTASAYRIAAKYSDTTSMLRESSLDVVFCEEAADENLPELVAELARHGTKHVWLGGVAAASADETLELAYWAQAHGVTLWSARPMRQAAAHRAAIGLVKRGEIGDVTALHLRWSTPFCATPETDATLRAATIAAVDLLAACAGSVAQTALVSDAKSTSSLWIGFAGGATATAIFASGDAWNSPLPRLEIIGTQGRFLVCEAGRRMGFFQPYEAARWIEPPGQAVHVSAVNVTGLAEDIKKFLTAAAQPESVADNCVWLETARALAVVEAAQRSRETEALEKVETLRYELSALSSHRESNGASTFGAPLSAQREAVLTLPLLG
jgi:predicted dehydrogenase